MTHRQFLNLEISMAYILTFSLEISSFKQKQSQLYLQCGSSSVCPWNGCGRQALCTMNSILNYTHSWKKAGT